MLCPQTTISLPFIVSGPHSLGHGNRLSKWPERHYDLMALYLADGKKLSVNQVLCIQLDIPEILPSWQTSDDEKFMLFLEVAL